MNKKELMEFIKNVVQKELNVSYKFPINGFVFGIDYKKADNKNELSLSIY